MYVDIRNTLSSIYMDTKLNMQGWHHYQTIENPDVVDISINLYVNLTLLTQGWHHCQTVKILRSNRLVSIANSLKILTNVDTFSCYMDIKLPIHGGHSCQPIENTDLVIGSMCCCWYHCIQATFEFVWGGWGGMQSHFCVNPNCSVEVVLFCVVVGVVTIRAQINFISSVFAQYKLMFWKICKMSKKVNVE